MMRSLLALGIAICVNISQQNDLLQSLTTNSHVNILWMFIFVATTSRYNEFEYRYVQSCSLKILYYYGKYTMVTTETSTVTIHYNSPHDI